MPVLKAGFCYFALVFGTGFFLGVIRVALLVPQLGERYAELVEMPLMLVAIIASARFVIARFSLPPRPSVRLSVGCLALAVLVAAELAVAYLAQGQAPRDYMDTRDPVSGSVYLAMLGLFALMPLIVLRRPDNSLERSREE